MVSLIIFFTFNCLAYDINISGEISTNVNNEHNESTLTSPCHYCKEELDCDNCTTNGRIELLVSTEKLSISGMKTCIFILLYGLSTRVVVFVVCIGHNGSICTRYARLD